MPHNNVVIQESIKRTFPNKTIAVKSNIFKARFNFISLDLMCITIHKNQKKITKKLGKRLVAYVYLLHELRNKVRKKDLKTQSRSIRLVSITNQEIGK